MLPSVRLACCTPRTVEIFKQPQWQVCGKNVLPSLLLSYAYKKIWEPLLSQIHYREFVLDSGAFTVHSKGITIGVEEYRDTVYQYRDQNIKMNEVFSLDVIGDWKGTKENTEYLWSQGICAIPAFHYGEPEDVLLGYAKDYPKIALGGAVGLPLKEKKRWVRQCFTRVWPKPIHGFGFGLWALNEFPFHSIDCSDWEGSAARFGKWGSFGGANLGISGKDLLTNLHSEAQHWLEHEHQAWGKWKRTFRQVGFTQNVGKPFVEVV